MPVLDFTRVLYDPLPTFPTLTRHLPSVDQWQQQSGGMRYLPRYISSIPCFMSSAFCLRPLDCTELLIRYHKLTKLSDHENDWA